MFICLFVVNFYAFVLLLGVNIPYLGLINQCIQSLLVAGCCLAMSWVDEENS